MQHLRPQNILPGSALDMRHNGNEQAKALTSVAKQIKTIQYCILRESLMQVSLEFHKSLTHRTLVIHAHETFMRWTSYESAVRVVREALTRLSHDSLF